MGIVLRALLAVVAFFVVSVANAQEYKSALVTADTLTVGTSGSAPPFSMTNAAGELEGFDIDVVNLLAKELGLTVTFEKLDFAGLLPGLPERVSGRPGNRLKTGATPAARGPGRRGGRRVCPEPDPAGAAGPGAGPGTALRTGRR